jgi:DNA-binding Lrp family transcriptional regulator
MSDKSSIDRIDGRILDELQKNARLSNKELAGRVGLAPSSCLERVRRLRRDGVPRGFHAEVDPGALGIGLQALIAVRLARHSRDLVPGRAWIPCRRS